MQPPTSHGIIDHPLARAAQRASAAAATRAEQLAEHRGRLQAGAGTSVAELVEAQVHLATARGRAHEARRRLVTHQLALAHHRVLGQDFLEAARRLARLTLSDEVRREPLDL
jgi:hypothetical protein